mmetsp:Transcript_7942/g.11767  ORF Transcript_7942/g.11767 Transcript_7942/m.11767 type:complete len:239 (-) Transcript_7942:995-1711(-)
MPHGRMLATALVTFSTFKPPATMTGSPLSCICLATFQSNVTPVPPCAPFTLVSSNTAIGLDVSDAIMSSTLDAESLPASICTTRMAGTEHSEHAWNPSSPCNCTQSSPTSATIALISSVGLFWNTPTTSGRRLATSIARAFFTRLGNGAALLLLPSTLILVAPSRSPNALTAVTTSFACSTDTFRFDFGTKMTPINVAPARHATNASSAFVMPQTLIIFVPPVYAPLEFVPLDAFKSL